MKISQKCGFDPIELPMLGSGLKEELMIVDDLLFLLAPQVPLSSWHLCGKTKNNCK